MDSRRIRLKKKKKKKPSPLPQPQLERRPAMNNLILTKLPKKRKQGGGEHQR